MCIAMPVPLYSKREIAYLLIYGSLPTKQQFDVFEREVLHHSAMHADSEEFFRSFRWVYESVSEGVLTAS